MQIPPNWPHLFIVLLVLYFSHWALSHDDHWSDQLLAPGLAYSYGL